MKKIFFDGEEGYFLKEEEKRLLNETLNSAKEYKESAEALLNIRREVKA